MHPKPTSQQKTPQQTIAQLQAQILREEAGSGNLRAEIASLKAPKPPPPPNPRKLYNIVETSRGDGPDMVRVKGKTPYEPPSLAAINHACSVFHEHIDARDNEYPYGYTVFTIGSDAYADVFCD